jgi:thiol-disulfide isomerase/thioredoxin
LFKISDSVVDWVVACYGLVNKLVEELRRKLKSRWVSRLRNGLLVVMFVCLSGCSKPDFTDTSGAGLYIEDLQSKWLVMNYWATWCGPCRREMPDLDALQDKLGSKDFLVLALSQDRKGVPAVQDFYKDVGVKHLSLYIDQKARTSRKLRVPGLPTTILLNRKGQEIGRLVGPADWFSKETQQIIKKYIPAKSRSAAPFLVEQQRSDSASTRNLE